MKSNWALQLTLSTRAPFEDADTRLTPREAEVLGWVARGHTNKEVAAILGVSHHTIRTQLEHVFEKLDVHTRTGAVAKAQAVLASAGGAR
jgi:DNA-binding CsgD family transcriptional regulator